jgi:two-component system, LytTR family, sensor histidine kinase AlgZ
LIKVAAENNTDRVPRRDPMSEVYCSARAVFLVVMVGFLLSLLLTLAGLTGTRSFWLSLGLNGFFVLWAGLLSLLLICGTYRWTIRFGTLGRGWIQFFIIQSVVLGLSILVVGVGKSQYFTGLPAFVDPTLFVLRNLGISVIASLVLFRYLVLYERWKAQVKAEAQSQLLALQTRIRPHFLFNTLNTISSLIHDQPDQAEQATMDLADLLRTGLREQGSHTLGDELELVRGYLRIEALRLGDRLQVEWSLADDLPLDGQVPALLIQPLVENAIVHGIAARPDGGVLLIRGERIRFGRIRFTIENPLSDDPPTRAAGNRTALENIRQRLALAFEEGAGLKTDSADGQFTATLTLPTPTGLT